MLVLVLLAASYSLLQLLVVGVGGCAAGGWGWACGLSPAGGRQPGAPGGSASARRGHEAGVYSLLTAAYSLWYVVCAVCCVLLSSRCIEGWSVVSVVYAACCVLRFGRSVVCRMRYGEQSICACACGSYAEETR